MKSWNQNHLQYRGANEMAQKVERNEWKQKLQTTINISTPEVLPPAQPLSGSLRVFIDPDWLPLLLPDWLTLISMPVCTATRAFDGKSVTDSEGNIYNNAIWKLRSHRHTVTGRLQEQFSTAHALGSWAREHWGFLVFKAFCNSPI